MTSYGKIYIHKTHSKRELVELVSHFHINVGDDPTKYNKKELQQVIVDKIETLSDDNINYDNKYFCNSVEDLINYLSNYNVRKILSVKEKETLMKISKRLQNYCRNDYRLEYTMYQNIYELINDAQKICKFGESPTIRKTIEALNKDPKINIELRPCLTPADSIALAEQEEKIKNEKNFKFKVRHATPDNPIILHFD